MPGSPDWLPSKPVGDIPGEGTTSRSTGPMPGQSCPSTGK